MAQNSNQKIKLLRIWEILQLRTDPENGITTQELIAELEKYGVSCERRSLYRDIQTLVENGYAVEKKRRQHSSIYFVTSRKFDIPELKIVMDAVQSASFIPEDKTKLLLDKLAHLGGGLKGEFLKRSSLHFMTVKHTNGDIYKNVDVIQNAVEKNCRIKFNYFHINEYRKKVYAHDGAAYCEEPIGMVLDDGNYYLLCYRKEKEYANNIKIFRIDRMDNVHITSKRICPEALKTSKKAAAYRLQAFKMYGGEMQNVTLQFPSELIEVVYDKFGHDTQIRRRGELFHAEVKVQISPTFWGWMLQFPTKMKIHAPEELKQEYAQWVKSAL